MTYDISSFSTVKVNSITFAGNNAPSGSFTYKNPVEKIIKYEGAWDADLTYTLIKIGRGCIFQISLGSDTSGKLNPSLLNSVTNFDKDYTPVSKVSFIIYGKNDATDALLILNINTDGSSTIGLSPANSCFYGNVAAVTSGGGSYITS